MRASHFCSSEANRLLFRRWPQLTDIVRDSSAAMQAAAAATAASAAAASGPEAQPSVSPQPSAVSEAPAAPLPTTPSVDAAASLSAALIAVDGHLCAVCESLALRGALDAAYALQRPLLAERHLQAVPGGPDGEALLARGKAMQVRVANASSGLGCLS